MCRQEWFFFFLYLSPGKKQCMPTHHRGYGMPLLSHHQSPNKKERTGKWIVIIKRLSSRKNLQTCRDFCDGDRSMKIGPIIKPLISNHI